MRLASFSLEGGRPRPGLVLGDEILDLSDPATGLPPTMVELLALGPEGLDGPAAPPPAPRRGTLSPRCGAMRPSPIRR